MHGPVWVGVVELLGQRGVPESVADDGMGFRVETRDESEVIRKCDGGEGGKHVRRRDARTDQSIEVRSQATIEEVGSEAVERDEERGWREERGAIRESLRDVGTAMGRPRGQEGAV